MVLLRFQAGRVPDGDGTDGGQPTARFWFDQTPGGGGLGQSACLQNKNKTFGFPLNTNQKEIPPKTRGRLARKHFSTGAHPAAETPFYIAAASVSAHGDAQCVWSHESSISSSYFPLELRRAISHETGLRKLHCSRLPRKLLSASCCAQVLCASCSAQVL